MNFLFHLLYFTVPEFLHFFLAFLFINTFILFVGHFLDFFLKTVLWVFFLKPLSNRSALPFLGTVSVDFLFSYSGKMKK